MSTPNHLKSTNTPLPTMEQQRMQGRATRRIMKEVKEMLDEEGRRILAEGGIYAHADEEDIYKIYVMLVGSEDTPYANGFYFFTFTFPENYPMSPPKGVSMTQGRIRMTNGETEQVRFNPNLYTCGKLCLSILGTWQGPGWIPTMTMSIVCNTIQGMVLHGVPLKNEPAYYDSSETDTRVLNYSKIITYANFKVGILDMLESRPSPFFEAFLPKMRELFLERFDQNMKNLHRARLDAPPEIRDECYGMGTIRLEYDAIEQRMFSMRDALRSAPELASIPPLVPSSSEEKIEKEKETIS